MTQVYSRQDICSSLGFDGNITPCFHSCGELYCCSNCRDAHWSTSHCLLCTGLIPDDEAETHPLVQFKVHAVQTNEIFLLCGEIFSKICLDVDTLMSRHLSLQEAIKESTKIYQSYVRKLWWDAAVAPVCLISFHFQHL